MKKGSPKKIAAQLAHPAEALQWGMNKARGFIFKHMSNEQKARYLLRKAMNQMGGL